MAEKIEDVTVVGGGDSGLLTALSIAKLNPGIDVTVVDDFQRDIPQVGKSTYSKILSILHETLEIDDFRFVTEVRPVWKGSVYFRDWCGYPEFQYPFDVHLKFPSVDDPDATEKYYYYYDELYASPDHHTAGEEIVAQRKSAYNYNPREGGYVRYDDVAYHLNTERFNSFLRELCDERGVTLADDEITDVAVADGRIEHVRSDRRTYDADLYVDATGFDRVLKSQLESEFTEFPFVLDSAFNARVERSLEEVVPATVVESGEYGWFWQIDTYDNRDLGYVYASEYVDDDAALAEFHEYIERVAPDGAARPGDDDVAKYEFTSGYFDRAWEGNCLAVGNAEGFVEPLQSTGLTANAQAAVNLANLLASHGRINDEGIRDTYNAWVRRSWESIADFISIHYKFGRGDTEFWEAMASMDVSDRVELLVGEFSRNGFDTKISPTENADVEDLLVFRPINFYEIMRKMGVRSAFYESHEFEVPDSVKEDEEEYYRGVREEVENYLSTKEFYKGVLEL